MYTVEYTSGECKQRLKRCTYYCTLYSIEYCLRMANRGGNPECVQGLYAVSTLPPHRHKHLSKWRAEKEKMFEDLCVARRACKISPLGRLWGLLNLKEGSEGQKWKSRCLPEDGVTKGGDLLLEVKTSFFSG